MLSLNWNTQADFQIFLNNFFFKVSKTHSFSLKQFLTFWKLQQKRTIWFSPTFQWDCLREHFSGNTLKTHLWTPKCQCPQLDSNFSFLNTLIVSLRHMLLAILLMTTKTDFGVSPWRIFIFSWKSQDTKSVFLHLCWARFHLMTPRTINS